MESYVKIPLLDRAAIIVAASLWYHDDVIETTRRFLVSKNFAQSVSLVKAVGNVNKNIQELPLTMVAKQRVQDFSAFVGKDISNWMQQHHFLTIDSAILSSILSWNPKGVIDSIETAKKVIAFERNETNRFRIACMYCLENYIFQLWSSVGQYYIENDAYLSNCIEARFWASFMEQKMTALMNDIEYLGTRTTQWFAFSMAVTNNNEIWVKHSLKQFSEDMMPKIAYSKLQNILSMAMSFNYEMIPLLFRYITSEMVEELILSYPGVILQQFLKFPNTHNFIEMAHKTWDALSDEEFYKITETLGHCLEEYAGNRIYKNILEQFWKNSPDHCKTYVITKCIYGSFLNRLGLRKHSSPIIKLIIQSSTKDQREEMVLSYNGILFFDSIVQKNRWGCLSMSVQEFVGSEDRDNWIDVLINTYEQIFKTIKLNSITCKDFTRLIEILEKQKDQNMHLKE